jgi:hypothetical protein
MKKIMFSDKYCLTKAVLDGAKTMTRRLLRDNVPLGNWEETAKYLPYKVGRVVAIAQSYNDIYNELEEQGDDVSNDWWIPSFEGKVLDTLAGYKNKMFVRSDLMLHHIKITDVKVERLQDISDEDCLREGIRYYHSFDKRWSNNSGYGYGYHIPKNGLHLFDTPYEAFANLFERISGKGTWESNPWVAAYEFKLID